MSPNRREILCDGRFLTQEITGVQRYAREVLNAMDLLIEDRPEISITLVTPKTNRPLPRFRNIAVRMEGRLNGHAWEQIELPAMARGKVLFCPGNVAPALSLLTSQKTVVCVHDLSYLYFPSAYSTGFKFFYNAIIPLIFRKADAVITVSESERKSIVERYPHVAPRLTAIQNGGISDDRAIAQSPSGAPGEPYVLYVGSLSKRKNFPNMLAVARRLAKSRGLKFVFVGGTAGGLVGADDGDGFQADDKIEFAGQINDTEELIRRYQSASVFMFASFYEASPLPPIEAMACGCPVVSSSIPSLLERCGDAALYCDPSNVDDIAARVEQVVDDEGLKADLSRRGRERASLFTWKNCAAKTLDVLLSV